MSQLEPGDTIYHKPACGTSRNAVATIRDAATEPHIIEHLGTPPSRGTLVSSFSRSGFNTPGAASGEGTTYAELGLGREELGDGQLIDAMTKHPVLINRSLVVSPLEVKLCRPSQALLGLLPTPQVGAFSREDGEAVVNAAGNRI